MPPFYRCSACPYELPAEMHLDGSPPTVHLFAHVQHNSGRKIAEERQIIGLGHLKKNKKILHYEGGG